jgi:hypothetical protein
VKLVAQGFDVDWNQLSRAKSLRWTFENSHNSTLCNSQQLTQPPLALAVPLSRFTSQVGGGSAFFVRPLRTTMKKHCCTDMTEAVTSSCEQHPDRFDCPDALIDYSPRSRRYGIIIHDGGSSSMTIAFCPWCGSSLGRGITKTRSIEI